jgi:hypothetical protein
MGLCNRDAGANTNTIRGGKSYFKKNAEEALRDDFDQKVMPMKR